MFTSEQIDKMFAYEHLKNDKLKDVSRQFYSLAHQIRHMVPVSPERTIALRNLWDAKNYAVWATANVQPDIPMTDPGPSRTIKEWAWLYYSTRSWALLEAHKKATRTGPRKWGFTDEMIREMKKHMTVCREHTRG